LVARAEFVPVLTDISFSSAAGIAVEPVEIYGEMELLRLLDRFLDRALSFATEGYEQHSQLRD
jgi:hypothetical protein